MCECFLEIHFIGIIWHGVVLKKGFPTIHRQVSYEWKKYIERDLKKVFNLEDKIQI